EIKEKIEIEKSWEYSARLKQQTFISRQTVKC
ncbi:MAG: hypothetical protein ACI9G1_004090, partial [Pirellulaceae bacterium]